MEKGQRGGSKWLQLEIGKGAVFEELPSTFCAMSTHTVLYENLSKLLTQEQWLNFIKALHLIMGKDKYYEQVKKDRCFHTSLLRNVPSKSLKKSVFIIAPKLINYKRIITLCKLYDN